MTYAPPPLIELGRYWTSKGGRNLGVVGDTRHVTKGRSYHLGRSQLTPDAYSRQTARDRAGLSDAASAIDLGALNGNLGQLRAFSRWFVERLRTNAPGTSDVREFIYSPDGKTVLRWDRERGVNSAPRTGEADASHLGHSHVSFYRDSERRSKVGLFSPYFAKEAPVAIDLSGPSNDTVTLLRQWLAVYKGAAVEPGSFFDQNRGDAGANIVQLTANIVGHGTAYYPKGSVTPSLLRLAQKLPGVGALTPEYAESLRTGLPKYAESIGVASESVVAKTGPRS